jgi:SIR2-like domain
MRFLYKVFKDELNQEDAVQIVDGFVDIRGEKFTAFEILKLATKEGQVDSVCNRVFSDWSAGFIERKIEEADDFLEQFGASDRFKSLVELCKFGGVVPFVGAGMSSPSGYPMWTDFLKNQRRQTNISQIDFERLLDAGEYEEAAQEIATHMRGPAFSEAVESSFSIERSVTGPVLLLPHVFENHVVTTNFDNVLERSYRDEGAEFSDVIRGCDAAELRRLLLKEQRVLLKLHGRAGTANGRILTKSEYDQHYTGDNTLGKTLGVLSDRFSFLFMGCGLTVDRTLFALREHVEKVGHDNLPRHYAFLAAPESENARITRQQQLVDYHIYPIWYPRGMHDESISALLLKIWSMR